MNLIFSRDVVRETNGRMVIFEGAILTWRRRLAPWSIGIIIYHHAQPRYGLGLVGGMTPREAWHLSGMV